MMSIMDMEYDDDPPVMLGFDSGVKVEIEADSDTDDSQNMTYSFKCSLCDRVYQYKKTLKLHLRKHHQIYDTPAKTVSCLEKDCFERFANITELREHLSSVHGKDIKSQTYVFNSLTDFSLWKEELEKETQSRFTFRSSWKKKNGSLHKVYNCNRSGSYTPLSNDKRKRKIKAQGTRKIGQECPARLVLTEEKMADGQSRVQVDAVLDHYGHDCDLSHLSFSRDERAFLQGKLATGVPKEKILNEIKSMAGDTNSQRLYYAKSKDLTNILSGLKKGLRQTEEQQETTVSSGAVSFIVEKDSNTADFEAHDHYEDESGSHMQSVPLQIEVLQDGNVRTDVRSHDELLRQVANLCVAVQGALLTREVSFDDLAQVEHKLKSCLATCNSHGLRKSGYPLEFLSVVSRESNSINNKNQKVMDELNKCDSNEQQQQQHERPYVVTSRDGKLEVEGMFDLGDVDEEVDEGRDDDVSNSAISNVPSESPVIFALKPIPFSYCFKPFGDTLTDFIFKTCSIEAVDKVRSGQLLGVHDLNLPETLVTYDRDILEINLDEVLSIFDVQAKLAVSEYVERVRGLWKCVVCCEIRSTEVVVCNHCLRSFHVTCVDNAETISDVWSCSDCCLQPLQPS